MTKQEIFSFYEGELRDIILSWLAVSIAFGWVMKEAFPEGFVFALVVAMVAVGTGFILHELAHRTVAIRFGAKARFVAWPGGLLLALAMAFFTGFVFAAPGAVYIFGSGIDKRQNGIISLAGPLTNVIIAIFFVAVAVLLNVNSPAGKIVNAAASINVFLAAFNLVPLRPLDGSKVFAWQPLLWALIFLPLVAVIFL